ncbi:MAG: hypothetical protein IKT14_03475, partial [Clostridiales bacterium]|nr:hypothetical protein [Clostridiales bacterium]
LDTLIVYYPVAYLTGDTNDITPDYLLIDKENDPELFSLIQTLTQKDETSKKLIEYYKKIKKDL